MKQHYIVAKLLLITSITFSLQSQAQSPTTVTNSSDCGTARTFTSSDEGFNSPSIYSDPDDAALYWNPVTGREEGNTGSSPDFRASLISSVYPSTTPGKVSVGFSYTAPSGTQYRVKVIQVSPATAINYLALTSWTTFSATAGSVCLLISDIDIEAGIGIRFEFSFRTPGAAGDITFDNFGMSGANAPLPVTFLGFVARKNDDATVKLLWDVADETNVQGYYIEKSIDGNNYTTLGFVPAGGKPVYSITDNLADTKVRFYRVKNVDIDGAYKYSTTIKVAGLNPDKRIQLYPVPAKGVINVQHETAPSKGVITLAGLEGRILIRKEVLANTQQTNLNVAALSPGIYIIRYEDGIGAVQTIKMVKE